MKLWQKNNTNISSIIEKFTIGDDPNLDLYLAQYDILGSFAHCLMLNKINLLTQKEIVLLKKEFKILYNLALQNKIKIDENVEDIHSQIEILLTKSLGELGKKIHSARSRNDQVLLDLKLFARTEIQEIVIITKELFNTLIEKSNEYKNVLMPGYTHFQIAMPSSFGLWFGAYAESLVEDLYTLESAYKICNQNPLGSGAGFGSSFPIKRKFTTQLLGFEDLNYNVVYAQMTRGKFEKICIQAISNIANTLNKLSMDICIYINENHKFLSLKNEFTTGSSIMPHKKNPDPFELIRAYTNQISSKVNELNLLTHNLPSGYHRDFQLTKSCLITTIINIKNCLNIAKLIIDSIEVNVNILNDEKYKYLFTVEEVNKLVLEGIPFRDAYKSIGNSVEKNQFKTNKLINHTHEGSIGNLCNNEIEKKMNNAIKNFNFNNTNIAIKKLIKMLD